MWQIPRMVPDPVFSLLRTIRKHGPVKLAPELDKKKKECRVIIETPKKRRNKFDYDPKIESFTLGGLLPEGLSFPFDFGFVPSTRAEDGDPLDVMVLMDEPAHVGCVLTVRLLGVIQAQQMSYAKTPAASEMSELP